jgi:hypothetical protein
MIANSDISGQETQIKPLAVNQLQTVNMKIGILDTLQVLGKVIGQALTLSDLSGISGMIKKLGLQLEYSFYAGNIFISQRQPIK